MAGKSKSQRSSRNQKPKYTFEEVKASIDMPSTSSSAEASTNKQADIVLETSGGDPVSVASTCEKAVAPSAEGAEKSVRRIAISLTVSEEQIRSWLDVPDTKKPKQTRKRAPRSTQAPANVIPKPKKQKGVFTLTEKRKEFVMDKMAKELSGENAAEFGSAESLRKLSNAIHVTPEHMRKWLGITDDLSQIIANSNLKVRGFEPRMEASQEDEAGKSSELEMVSSDDGSVGKMLETEDVTEILEVPKDKCPEEVAEAKDNSSQEDVAEVPKVNEDPEEILEVIMVLEDPEEIVEVPKVIDEPEEMAEVLEGIAGPVEKVFQPEAEATRQSPIPVIDGETVKLVSCEPLVDDDEASSVVGEIVMSNDDNVENVSSSSESAEKEETGETQLIQTDGIGNGKDENPLEKKEAVAVVIAEPEVPSKDIPEQQSSSPANSKSDEKDTSSIPPKDAEEAKVPAPTPAKRKTRIHDYFPKLKNMRTA